MAGPVCLSEVTDTNRAGDGDHNDLGNLFQSAQKLYRSSAVKKMTVAVEDVENGIMSVPRPLVTVREMHVVFAILVNLIGPGAVRFPDGDYLSHAGIQEREAE